MTILALDQSSRITGYAIFKDNKLHNSGKFTIGNEDLGQRLVKIRNKVAQLIDQYQPDHVVFEDIQQQNNVANNVQTFKVLACVYGVICELLTELHIDYSIILATSWKSALGIKGRTRAEQKRNAQQYVLDIYNKKCTQDEVDSICIGAAYLQYNGRSAWD